MRVLKFSLACALAFGCNISANATQTLVDALKNGTPTVELRASYFSRDNKNESRTGIANLGVALGYTTDSFYGFSLGALAQSSFAPWASQKQKQKYARDLYGSGVVLSELYLKYDIGETSIKFGRQFIKTPLINSSGGRMIVQSFQGATINGKELENTTLWAAYINKYQGRTSVGSGDETDWRKSDIPNFTKHINFIVGNGRGGINTRGTFEGLYSFMAQNSSVSNLKLTAQYANLLDYKPNSAQKGDVSMYFIAARYTLPFENFKLVFEANINGSKAASAFKDYNIDGKYYAAKIGFKELAGFNAGFAYSFVSSADSVAIGVGNGVVTLTQTPYSGPLNSVGANTDTYHFNLEYDFAEMGADGLRAELVYAKNEQKVARKIEHDTYYAGVDYTPKSIKGLKLHLGYEHQNRSEDGAKTESKDEIRARAFYKF